jgi:hypothetical protein
MTFRLLYSEKSKPEIQESYNHYEDEQAGLGEKFLLKLDEILERIVKTPFSFPQKGKFRECYIGVFPFLVIDEIKGNSIYIHAVFHTSRNPKKKNKSR